MAEYVRGELLNEGKTKIIFSVKGHEDLVWIENKNDITANDDESFTKRFGTKAVCATKTTVNVFKLLNEAGIPTAFVEQISETEFIAKKCEMIQLEVIARRLAVGSFTKRRPDLAAKKGEKPHRFHRLVTEFFLKTTKGQLNGKDIGLPDIPKADGGTKKLDDPLIVDAFKFEWQLAMPKQPSWEKGALLDVIVNSGEFFGDLSPAETLEKMDSMNRKSFLIIEAAWAMLGYILVDWKIEFGILPDGTIVIADVIDNDSWRLRGPNFEELSKQLHRDGKSLDEIEAKYGLVSQMTDQFRIPKQALVVWKGSPDDESPKVPDIPGIEKKEIALSGHKKSQQCLAKLEELLRDYPEGGVIIFPVGMSNGLGPTISSHTSWVGVGVPTHIKEHPEDVWSSLRLPSQNPMATILSPKNAVLFALNVLGQKNPAVYMERQFAIENLDTGY